MGNPAIEVLRGIQRREDSPWVVTGLKRGTRLAFPHGPWRLILERAGIGNLRIHDLWHSFSSGGLMVGEGPSDDRQAAQAQQGADHRPLRPSRQRPRQVRGQPHSEQDR